MSRAYYDSDIKNFLGEDIHAILGKLSTHHEFKLTEQQRNSWISEIDILKKGLKGFEEGHVILEYTVPRIGRRVDAILIVSGLLFVVEFKIEDKSYKKAALNQVIDYALDLKDFHEGSHELFIIPVLCSSGASECAFVPNFTILNSISGIQKCNQNSFRNIITCSISAYKKFSKPTLSADMWINSRYKPTPTIIEAAKALYRTHTVRDISRNDASAFNLSKTINEINKIIEYTKDNHLKSICFITGVPGAGKTLAGLNIAVEQQHIHQNEHAVFLSGNGPLVAVLQEALARDQQERENIKKSEAKRKAQEFIQLIHHFRDDALAAEHAPIERVVIFDEAQRAWTREMLEAFMKQKKGIMNFSQSEPEFLISIMNRHEDWAVIVCLVGEGQEINTGEAGLQEWFTALNTKFPEWNIFISNQLFESEYLSNKSLKSSLEDIKYTLVPELHLAVSLRSYRSENVANFIRMLLDFDLENAREAYRLVSKNYPVVLTRNLRIAKNWIREHAKGTQRYGQIASSGAKRLKSEDVWVQSKIDPIAWFLNDEDDVRSSYSLEDTATEFDIQGLELDWAIVCWDANLRVGPEGFEFYSFTGTKWHTIHKFEDKIYLKNAYRVLLTRARQGFIIFISEGDDSDRTRKKFFYDNIYNYLKTIGIQEI